MATTKKPRRPISSSSLRVSNTRSLVDDLRAISKRSVLVAAAAAKGDLTPDIAFRSARIDAYEVEQILDAINDEAVQ